MVLYIIFAYTCTLIQMSIAEAEMYPAFMVQRYCAT